MKLLIVPRTIDTRWPDISQFFKRNILRRVFSIIKFYDLYLLKYIHRTCNEFQCKSDYTLLKRNVIRKITGLFTDELALKGLNYDFSFFHLWKY